MGKTIARFSMSPDGFIAAPDDTVIDDDRVTHLVYTVRPVRP